MSVHLGIPSTPKASEDACLQRTVVRNAGKTTKCRNTLRKGAAALVLIGVCISLVAIDHLLWNANGVSMSNMLILCSKYKFYLTNHPHV